MRAAYATFWEKTRGRLYKERPSTLRTPYRRDCDRIIHATAFRRLKHKTQVFIAPRLDHYRTRLTHSLEVAQIAKTLACALHVDENLTEAVSLAHDLGHPPFGHTGEEALAELMTDFGGFDHNDYGLRTVIKLEKSYPEFEGLNLSYETLEGIVKHNGPISKPLPFTLKSYQEKNDLELDKYCGLEGQIAAVSDDIAYNHHDLDDGLRSGLFSVDDISCAVPHVGKVYEAICKAYPNSTQGIRACELIRRLIGAGVDDCLHATQEKIIQSGVTTANDVRQQKEALVVLSNQGSIEQAELKSFLFKNMYYSPEILKERAQGFKIIKFIFKTFLEDSGKLPQEWQLSDKTPIEKRARHLADYMAGMTDNFAVNLYHDLKA